MTTYRIARGPDMPATPAAPTGLTIFGREPAVYVGLLQAAISVLLAVHVLRISPDQAGVVIAFVTAALGVYTAYAVHDTLLAVAVTASKCGVALAIAFGLDLSTDQIGVVMTFVTLALSFFLRTQTSPEVDAFTEPLDNPNAEPAVG